MHLASFVSWFDYDLYELVYDTRVELRFIIDKSIVNLYKIIDDLLYKFVDLYG